MEALKPLGLEMSNRLVDALGGDPAVIDGYGKGTIVGEAGELEHGALWHVPGGYGMREVLGDSRAIVPSSKKVGGMGARLDVPIGHINAAYVRSHFDAMELGVPGRSPGRRDGPESRYDGGATGARPRRRPRNVRREGRGRAAMTRA